MKKSATALALVLALLAHTALAGTECGWIPVCIPVAVPPEPPIEALVVYVNGTLDREIRPWWDSDGGRSAFWHCAERTAGIRIAYFRGGIESPKSGTPPPEGNWFGNEACPMPSPNLEFMQGAYYGPWEQAFRAIHNNYFGGGPIDVNQDGLVNAADQDLLELTLKGYFGPPMPTDKLCLPYLNQPCP